MANHDWVARPGRGILTDRGGDPRSPCCYTGSTAVVGVNANQLLGGVALGVERVYRPHGPPALLPSLSSVATGSGTECASVNGYEPRQFGTWGTIDSCGSVRELASVRKCVCRVRRYRGDSERSLGLPAPPRLSPR